MELKNQCTVLIIDDNENNLQLTAKILHSNGYEIILSSDGKSALEILESTIPDAILLDIMIPGMNGFDICRSIRQRPELTTIPVLFLSAIGDDAIIEKGLEMGGTDYITKPLRERVLLARLKHHIEHGLYQKEIMEKNRLLTDMQEQLLMANHDLEKQIERNLTIFATLNDKIRNPLTIAMSMLEMQENTETKKIINCLEMIDSVIDEVDKGFLDSDKVRAYLKKHYSID